MFIYKDIMPTPTKCMCNITEIHGIILYWNYANGDYNYTYGNVKAGYSSLLRQLYCALNVLYNINVARIRVSERVVDEWLIVWHKITDFTKLNI